MKLRDCPAECLYNSVKVGQLVHPQTQLEISYQSPTFALFLSCFILNLSLFFICLFLSCLNLDVQIGDIYKFKGVYV